MTDDLNPDDFPSATNDPDGEWVIQCRKGYWTHDRTWDSDPRLAKVFTQSKVAHGAIAHARYHTSHQGPIEVEEI